MNSDLKLTTKQSRSSTWSPYPSFLSVMPRLHSLCYNILALYVVPVIYYLSIGFLSIALKTWFGSIYSIITNWTSGWFGWTRQSEEMLRNAEIQILSCLKTYYKRYFVDIGSVVGQCDRIWTISLNEESPKLPLVLLHGMAAGVALWCPNLDALASARPVYAIDLLGFGRSSRPQFSSNAKKVEAQWVESVEEWRREVNLQEFILLGHSLGGYLATAYAMRYPERVRHLILADPWGFPSRASSLAASERQQLPLWVRTVAALLHPLNPLWAVRAAGPAGRWLVSKTRPDLPRKYLPYLPHAETLIPHYIHQCNAQTPSGESAFHALQDGLEFAKNPMADRLYKLDPDIEITLLYGSRSWVIHSAAEVLKDRPKSSKTYVHVINGAGHHIYLDKAELFNKYVLDTCARVENRQRPPEEDARDRQSDQNTEASS